MKVIRTRLIPFGFSAMAFPSFCLVRPDIPPDRVKILIEHEKVHARQMKSWLRWPFYVLRYFFHKPFRAKVEAEAYGEVELLAAYYDKLKLSSPNPNQHSKLNIGLPSRYIADLIHRRYRLGGFGFGRWPSADEILQTLLESYRAARS